ncbi:MAG: hypothetical protein ACRDGM_17435 [bacterium]
MEESPLLVLTGIASELIPDAGIAEVRAIGSSDPLLWRSYVRAVFALIEGLNYARLHVARQSPHLTAEARQRAHEAAQAEKKVAKADDAGGVTSPTRVSCAAHAAAHGVQNPLAPSGPDWDALLDAVAIRNRITHPKSGADCRVSEAEWQLVRRVHHWYQQLDTQLMDATHQSNQGGVEQGDAADKAVL